MSNDLCKEFAMRVAAPSHPYELARREARTDRTVVRVGDVEIGGDQLVIIAGPCSVESEGQIHAAARIVAEGGAHILRGGCYKPRTSPYSFQGLGEEGLRYLAAAGRAVGLPTISEVMESEWVEQVASYVDILQVGSRNMQNFSLLKRLGRIQKPVLLKRGFSATYEDLLMAAEYILDGGNERVILCERGIRTFEGYTRNTLDLAAVPALKSLSHLPVIVDPSHGTGRQELVVPMAQAAVIAGADGIMVEVHPNPSESLSDPHQALSGELFEEMMRVMPHFSQLMGRKII
jgi:3-deoxy-7-phosphoheptulonate synthase